MKQRILKSISLTLIFSFAYQLALPLKALALTTGPSQPEMQGFEPVGTTEMVDLFSGDFVYNIPLLDIDGYPVNIAYHSGVGPEQEASWVGLGWSLNPGQINRAVRGLPDDINGDMINKKLKIENETNFTGKVGVEVGSEILGLDLKNFGVNLGANLSVALNSNNYKGLSASLRAGVTASYTPTSGNMGSVGFSPSIGIGSQSGVDADASLSFSLSQSDKKNPDYATTASVGVGSGINSRQGMTQIGFNVGISRSKYEGTVRKTETSKRSKTISNSAGSSFGSAVPIGIKNYVPVITNASTVSSFYIQLKLGLEAFGIYPNFLVGVGVSKMELDENGSRKGYGYMYLENAPASKDGILDFIRDKDGMYNKTMSYLPLSSLAYDIYTVSGQGTGGSFRPYRNDVGTIYDPVMSRSSENKTGAIELGFSPNLLSVGADINVYKNEVEAGPWVTVDYRGDLDGTLYEKLFFKQGGELTYNNQMGVSLSPNNSTFSSSEPIMVKANYDNEKFSKKNDNVNITYAVQGSAYKSLSKEMGYEGTIHARTPRANLISAYTAAKADKKEITWDNSDINGGGTKKNYILSHTLNYATGAVTVSRTDRLVNRNKDRLDYVSQLLPDGRRYVYGIPAMNNISKDITWGHATTDALVAFSGGVLKNVTTKNETQTASFPAPEKYFSSSETPGYAHAFLLTDVLSPDYVDITGDGSTDDDLGGYVRFNYNRISNDYRWRTPSEASSVHYDPGFLSDKNDGKASISMGSREQWYLQTIESKNYVAEFYTSKRGDGKGIPEQITSTYSASTTEDQHSYKLDSIRLFNKNDRYQNQGSAIPIKTIILKYDYSLCQGTPNVDASLNPSGGKLTLRKLYIRYGNSDKNLVSPYQFNYNTPNPNYNYGGKDRWGYAKSINSGLNNFEFPYTSQASAGLNADMATSYSLTDIILPSGGTVHVDYEADDYGYVQDKRAMEMAMIKGFGNSADFTAGSVLYENKDRQFDYVYIERKPDDGLTGASASNEVRKAYFENEKNIYYSVATDIRAGNYEHIKGFAEIDQIGICPNNTGYFYVKLKRIESSGINFNPVALYAMNYSKYYINHIFYPGYGSSDFSSVLQAFKAAAGEIKHMSKPHQTFVERNYCKHINLAKSWVRMQSPTLSKKGGGSRVKKLTLSDQWSQMAGGSVQKTGTYGREYDYAIYDPNYGRKISSGVASNEPMPGGDENALRQPVPYTQDKNMALPAITFYQLEPIGESFYPGGSVGYSSVRVRSIHIDKSRSAMSEEENLFYTAKDFPVRTAISSKNTNSFTKSSLMVRNSLEQVSQGYTLFFNDMHGKPKAVNNYIVKEFDNNEVKERTLVDGVVYRYNKDAQGRLDSKVMTLMRESGNYVVRQAELGKEVDLTFDSRRNYDASESMGANINLNVMMFAIAAIPIPSVFPSYSQQMDIFHSMAATKIVQQYGILKKVEYIDHGSKTIVENMVYDGESGMVVLSKTNNEYNDPEYIEKIPAYYAYEGMGPAYTNIGFKEQPLELYINSLREGYLRTNNPDKYAEGDELLYQKGADIKRLWVTKKGYVNLADYYALGSTGVGHIAIIPDEPLEVRVTINVPGHPPIYNAVSVASLGDNDPFKLSLVPNVNLFQLPDDGEKYDLEVEAVNDEGCASKFVYKFNNRINNLTVFRIQKKECNVNYEYEYHCHLDKRPCLTVYRDDNHSCCLMPTSIGDQCVVQVMPRNTFSHAPNTTNNTSWGTGGSLPETITGFKTEIVRSGKRNMLGATVQESSGTEMPTAPAEGATLSSLMFKTSLIGVSAQTYTDTARNYEGYNANRTSTATGDIAEGYNRFVLGQRGNYRPLASLAPLRDRTYTVTPMMHGRKDGVFSLSSLYWQVGAPADCGAKNVLVQLPSSIWQAASMVTKYDMNGNALEELNSVGIYSSAQYGFNQKMPVAVTNNARQGSSAFESFEELNSIILPNATREMYYNTTTPSAYLYSPVAQVIRGFASGYTVTYANQKYYKLDATQSGVSATVSTADAHTGKRSLSVTGSFLMPLNLKTVESNDVISSYYTLKSKKYLFQFWQKQGSSATTRIATYTSTTNRSTVALFSAVGLPVNGWQLMQVEYSPSALGAQQQLCLEVIGSLVMDDLRVLPVDADMKTFVYDNLTNRLKAQLDENHYATFYEYDAEGQLVRVKKETEKGIITIRENRKSNVKNF